MNLQEAVDFCGFTDFPFDLKPNKSPQVWAGRKDVLQQLEEFRYNVEVNGLVEFGILTGEHGSGKSHSLLHLKYLIESAASEESRSLCIYVDNPTGLGPKQTFLENYRYILNHALDSEKVKNVFSHAEAVVNKRVSLKLEQMQPEERRGITQEELRLKQLREQVYDDLIGESPINYRLFRAIAQGESGSWEWLTAGGLSEVGGEEVQPLASHILCAKSLATIVKLSTLVGDEVPSLYRAIFILVDQTEDLAGLKPGPFLEQITGWRTLIDESEGKLGVMWAMDGAAEDVNANFTDAINRRQTILPEKLRLLPLEGEEPKRFLTDVMKNFRKGDAQVPSEVYPFTDDGLDEAIAQTPVKIPSFLLNTCRTIFTRAARENLLSNTGDVLDRQKVSGLV